MENPVLSVIRQEQVNVDELFTKLPRETQDHSERVAALSELLLGWAAREFPGEYETPSGEELRRTARYHDIGMALVPTRLLEKEEDLTGPEFRVIQRHVHYGSSLLDEYRRTAAHTPEQERFWTLASEIALGHHERWDGKGYPFGQLTSATPDAVRIVSVADAFDSIVYGGNYRMPLPMEYAVLEIMQNAGKQFDPALAELFRANCEPVFAFYQELGGMSHDS